MDMEEAQTRLPEDGAKAGKRLHDINQVPHALRQEAQARWGVNMDFNATRENGRYNGPVFTGDEYVVQRVGEKSVMFHRKEQIDFATNANMQKRFEENRLNDANLSIRYLGDKGKANFHDPQRALIEEMFGRIQKIARERYDELEQPDLYEKLSRQLDEIKTDMVEQYKEVKNRQFEQRTGQQRAIESQGHPAKSLER
jgi:hypothetical protein